MVEPKPITIEYVDEGDYEGTQAPQPFVIIGEAPDEDTVGFEAQEAPVIDDSPADADAVAADLQAVVDALIAAGIFTEPE